MKTILHTPVYYTHTCIHIHTACQKVNNKSRFTLIWSTCSCQHYFYWKYHLVWKKKPIIHTFLSLILILSPIIQVVWYPTSIMYNQNFNPQWKLDLWIIEFLLVARIVYQRKRWENRVYFYFSVPTCQKLQMGTFPFPLVLITDEFQVVFYKTLIQFLC